MVRPLHGGRASAPALGATSVPAAALAAALTTTSISPAITIPAALTAAALTTAAVPSSADAATIAPRAATLTAASIAASSASASASASSPAPAWFPGALMSAGGTVCEAGAALLADHMCLSGAYFAAASTALAKVDAATAPHAATNVLAAQQAALAEARATFEAMLAANSAEVRALTLTLTPPRPKPKPSPSLTKPNQVRALTDEAMHHLLPLCALVPVAE